MQLLTPEVPAQADICEGDSGTKGIHHCEQMANRVRSKKSTYRACATAQEAHCGALILWRWQHLIQALAPCVDLPLLLPLLLFLLRSADASHYRAMKISANTLSCMRCSST